MSGPRARAPAAFSRLFVRLPHGLATLFEEKERAQLPTQRSKGSARSRSSVVSGTHLGAVSVGVGVGRPRAGRAARERAVSVRGGVRRSLLQQPAVMITWLGTEFGTCYSLAPGARLAGSPGRHRRRGSDPKPKIRALATAPAPPSQENGAEPIHELIAARRCGSVLSGLPAPCIGTPVVTAEHRPVGRKPPSPVVTCRFAFLRRARR